MMTFRYDLIFAWKPEGTKTRLSVAWNGSVLTSSSLIALRSPILLMLLFSLSLTPSNARSGESKYLNFSPCYKEVDRKVRMGIAPAPRLDKHCGKKGSDGGGVEIN
jgi:hypothetical protein